MTAWEAISSHGIINQLMTLRDPRTTSWKTLQDPTYIIALLVVYVFMAKVWGPHFMKNRRPYKIDALIQIYNVFQIAANIYYCTRIAYVAYRKRNLSPICQGIDYNASEDALELVTLVYNYYAIRICDLADTVFFVLQKKFSHVSKLHVIHHAVVVVAGWQWLRFGSDGQTILAICLNSSVHVIMYSYYFLAKLGPNVRKHLWWKKYMTIVQILQFVVLIGHALIPALVMECGYPMSLTVLAVIKMCLILALFLNFYIKSYIAASELRASSTESLSSKAN